MPALGLEDPVGHERERENRLLRIHLLGEWTVLQYNPEYNTHIIQFLTRNY